MNFPRVGGACTRDPSGGMPHAAASPEGALSCGRCTFVLTWPFHNSTEIEANLEETDSDANIVCPRAGKACPGPRKIPLPTVEESSFHLVNFIRKIISVKTSLLDTSAIF